jgi:hypothetical protein
MSPPFVFKKTKYTILAWAIIVLVIFGVALLFGSPKEPDDTKPDGNVTQQAE